MERKRENKGKGGREKKKVERVAKLVCGRRAEEEGEGEKKASGERELAIYRPYARLALANHTGVCIEMRNGADRPATITPIS